VTTVPAATETRSAGDLSDQSVANRQQRIGLGCRRERHAMLHHTDRESTEEIDEDDDETGDGIALYELAAPSMAPKR